MGGVTGLPVAASQTMAVPSSLELAAHFPSGLKVAKSTPSRCGSGGPMAWPLAAFQICALRASCERSVGAVMIRLPSG